MVILLGNYSQSVTCQVDEKIKENTNADTAWTSDKQFTPELDDIKQVEKSKRFSFHKFFRWGKLHMLRKHGNSNEETHKSEVEGHMELRRHVNMEDWANVGRMKKKSGCCVVRNKEAEMEDVGMELVQATHGRIIFIRYFFYPNKCFISIEIFHWK